MNKKGAKEALTAVETTSPSYYELARGYAKEGLLKSAQKSNELLQKSTPNTTTNAAVHVLRSFGAGAKNYGNAAKYATMGFLEGVHQQNPNDGRQLQNMVINQKIQRDGQAARALKDVSGNSVLKDSSKAANVLNGKSNGVSRGVNAGNRQSKSSGQGR